MPPPSQQGSEGTGIIWIVLGAVLLLGLTWYFAHEYIVRGFFFLKQFEIEILRFFTAKMIPLEGVQQFIAETPPAQISFGEMSFVANQIGNYLRIPLIIIMGFMTTILLSKNVKTRYSQTYTMESLLRSEVEVWPYTQVTMNLKLVDQDIHQGPWAMAMQPLAFAKKHRLFKEIITPGEGLSAKRKSTLILLKSKAAHVFSRQLGRPWEGIKALEDHTKALYAAFTAKSARDSTTAAHLLLQFAASAAKGRLDLSGVSEILSQYKEYPPVVEITERHAYVLTVMASMLQLARSDGVVSSAEFLWLKPIDRRLWFMLNGVGRQTAVAEIAGPFAHWLAEKEMGRKLRTPMIDQAVQALDASLQDILYVPSKI